MGRIDNGLQARSRPMERRFQDKKVSMFPFEQCPVCNGPLTEKQVEKILRGGDDTAVLSVHAQVCLQCGEKLYSEDTVRLFEGIRARLEKKETQGFTPIGKVFRIA